MKLFFILFALSLNACSSSPQWEAVYKNRESFGAYQNGACALYVSELQAHLNFPTEIATFDIKYNLPFSQVTRHRILGFAVGNDYWFIDNMICRPRWVGSLQDPIEQRIKQFFAPDTVFISNIVVDRN